MKTLLDLFVFAKDMSEISIDWNFEENIGLMSISCKITFRKGRVIYSKITGVECRVELKNILSKHLKEKNDTLLVNRLQYLNRYTQ